MRFAKPKCPTCRQYATGSEETVLATASLSRQKGGTFEFGGDTEVWWDSQESRCTKDGVLLLSCREGHEWESKVTFEEAAQKVPA